MPGGMTGRCYDGGPVAPGLRTASAAPTTRGRGRAGVAQPMHDAQVDLDFGAMGMKAGQGRQQQVVRQLRGRADHQRAAGPPCRPADGEVERAHLIEQRPARLKVGLAAGRQRQPARAAVEEPHPATGFERSDELVD